MPTDHGPRSSRSLQCCLRKMSSPPGHVIPQADGSGDQSDPVRYRSIEHLNLKHRRANSSQPTLPPSEGPPAPYSPPSQRPLLDLQPAPAAATVSMAPLAQEETQLLPDSPRGYISPAVSHHHNTFFLTDLKRFIL